MKHTSIVLVVLTLALVVLLSLPSAAAAWQASGFAKIAVDEDSFYNYDCESASALATNVDWPVMFVFYGNATVAKVDKSLSSRLPIWGVNEYFDLWDNPTTGQWVANTGVKSISLSKALHMRLYGAGGVCSTNATWGHYVLATCHYDINELSKNPTFGYSEDAATQIASMCRSAWGTSRVTANAFPLGNLELLRVEKRANSKGGYDTHTWQSDGLATLVYVP